jgi:hypothetical protein
MNPLNRAFSDLTRLTNLLGDTNPVFLFWVLTCGRRRWWRKRGERQNGKSGGSEQLDCTG